MLGQGYANLGFQSIETENPGEVLLAQFNAEGA